MKGRLSYGWVIVVIAALSMVATLPGRTVGLGLITEPLISELGLPRTEFARLNLVATLLGSFFALLAGRLTDLWGIRLILTATLLLLGSVILTMSQVATAGSIALFLILSRGLGQSGLSTTSVTCVGKWFTDKLAIAMGVFSLMVAIGFSAAIVLSQAQVEVIGWRRVWTGIGGAVLALGFVSALLTRSSPSIRPGSAAATTGHGFTLTQALKTPCFWIFSVGMALYSGMLAAVSLFNESILQELGFGAETFRYAMAGLMSAGLLGNLVAAWAAPRFGLPRIMSVSLGVLALALLLYSRLSTSWQVILHASGYGFCGGVFSVLFFTGFGHAFGRTHLGKIQGAAQMMTVITSALAPWGLASAQETYQSYFTVMPYLAPAFAIVAIAAWFTRMPSHQADG